MAATKKTLLICIAMPLLIAALCTLLPGAEARDVVLVKRSPLFPVPQPTVDLIVRLEPVLRTLLGILSPIGG